MLKGGFIKNLPKIYGLYTGGFAIFIILMAIAEQAGMSAKNIGIMFVGIYSIDLCFNWLFIKNCTSRCLLCCWKTSALLCLMEWQQLLIGCQVHHL